MATKRTVLIIDDDIMLLKMTEESLSSTYAVSLAKSGEQAIKLLQTGFLPDIMLLDINMPTMDGYETMKKLRDIPGVSELPIVFLTGINESSAELKGLHAGAVDYIRKPFVNDVLLARLQMHLESSQSKRLLLSLQSKKSINGIDDIKLEAITALLTETEQKIAKLIALGYTNQEIGEELNYSYFYVKKVTANIFGKLNITKRNELRKLLM